LPNGQFGTRLLGGKDSASERYIFTALNPITRHIFREADDAVLRYLNDDGTPVEPVYYAPIIPMVLVNGSKGIGTGFSTDIMTYNPKHIIARLRNILLTGNGGDVTLQTYCHGFSGSIEWRDDKYVITGVYEVINDTHVRVTELPIGTWTEDYKVYLESLINPKDGKDGKKSNTKQYVRSYTDMSTDTTVDITIVFAKDAIDELVTDSAQYGKNGLQKLLKLYTTHSRNNMHLFDSDEKLKKYETAEDIMDDFVGKRLEIYGLRKEHQIKEMEAELQVLSNKAKFIQYNLTDKIDLRRKSKDDVTKILEDYEFDRVNDTFNYLIKMPMDSVTKEKADEILKERDTKASALENLRGKTTKDLWIEELDDLSAEYEKFLRGNEDNDVQKTKTTKQSTVKRVIKKRVLKKQPTE